MPRRPDLPTFADMAKRNRVFVLGAGFSAAAGIPLTNRLLQDAFKLFSIECPGIYGRVASYASDASCQDVESLDVDSLDLSELCTFLEFVELREYGGGERWSENGSREKLALRFYLAKAIANSTPTLETVPELYRLFASQLQPGDIVISFNWDCLLEIALKAVGKHYTYSSRMRARGDEIFIAKLHGSVNWRLREPRRLNGDALVLNWRKLDFGGAPQVPSMHCSADLLRRETWQQIQPLSEVDPYLVLPGYGKAFDVRANSSLWYKPDFAFDYTHDVYVIGLSLADDDFFVKSFFLSTLPYLNEFTETTGRRVVIINPARIDELSRSYEFVLRTGFAEIWNEPLDVSHVERIVRATISA